MSSAPKKAGSRKAEARAARNEVILNAWAHGATAAAIAEEVGVGENTVIKVTKSARAAGDPRAIVHKRGRRLGVRVPPPPRRPEMQARQEMILDAWAAGKDMQALAESLGVSRQVISQEIVQAREAGDPRAAKRRRPRSRNADAALDLRAQGTSFRDIAELLGTTVHVINRMVRNARAEGDPRVAWRYLRGPVRATADTAANMTGVKA